MDSVSPFQQCFWRRKLGKLDLLSLPPIRKNEAIAGSQLRTNCLPTVWQEYFWHGHPSANSASAEEPWKMDDQQEEHHDLQHALQGVSAVLLRKPTQTTAPGSVSLLRVTNSPLHCQRWGVRGRGQSGLQVSGENTNQKETLGLSAWFLLAVGSIFFSSSLVYPLEQSAFLFLVLQKSSSKDGSHTHKWLSLSVVTLWQQDFTAVSPWICSHSRWL